MNPALWGQSLNCRHSSYDSDPASGKGLWQAKWGGGGPQGTSGHMAKGFSQGPCLPGLEGPQDCQNLAWVLVLPAEEGLQVGEGPAQVWHLAWGTSSPSCVCGGRGSSTCAGGSLCRAGATGPQGPGVPMELQGAQAAPDQTCGSQKTRQMDCRLEEAGCCCLKHTPSMLQEVESTVLGSGSPQVNCLR